MLPSVRVIPLHSEPYTTCTLHLAYVSDGSDVTIECETSTRSREVAITSCCCWWKHTGPAFRNGGLSRVNFVTCPMNMKLLPRMPTRSLVAARRTGVLARHMASTSASSDVQEEVTTPTPAFFLLLKSEVLAARQV